MNDQELWNLWDKSRRCFVLEFPISVTAKDLEQITREALAYRGIKQRLGSHVPASEVALPSGIQPDTIQVGGVTCQPNRETNKGSCSRSLARIG